jgi:hypothetical protein
MFFSSCKFLLNFLLESFSNFLLYFVVASGFLKFHGPILYSVDENIPMSQTSALYSLSELVLLMPR